MSWVYVGANEMAYSEDLRKRVLDFVAEGGSKQAAAERFNVAFSTVYLWCQTPEKVRAEKPGSKGCSKTQMITARPTAYHVELALPLRVSRRWVGRGLKKLKLTHKKNDNVPRKRRLL